MRDRTPGDFDGFTSAEAKARYLAAYDAVLAGWPVAREELLVPTCLGLTHVVASGPTDAPSVVLLHAFFATALVWRPNVEALSRHFRVYAVDVIGQGGKSAPDRPIRTRRDYADWLDDLLEGLSVAQAALVGNSYGGFLALNQASLAPARVTRVVMINPAGVFASFGPLLLRMMIGGLLSAVRPEAKRPPLRLESYLGRNVELGSGDIPWAKLVSMAAIERDLRPAAIFPPVFSTAELRAVHAPALLVMGDNDLLYDPHKMAARAATRMPTLQVEMVPGAHHMAALAKPTEVNARIISFLTRAYPC